MQSVMSLCNFSLKLFRSTFNYYPPLINSANSQLTQVRTFKDKDVLKKRCKDCRFTKIDDRWWVLCSTHPRHKQRQKIEDIRTRWIVTHITRGGRPFQKKPEAYILNNAPPAFYDYVPKIWWKQDLYIKGELVNKRTGRPVKVIK